MSEEEQEAHNENNTMPDEGQEAPNENNTMPDEGHEAPNEAETYASLEQKECCRIGEKAYNQNPGFPSENEQNFFNNEARNCKGKVNGDTGIMSKCGNGPTTDVFWRDWDNSEFVKLECCRLEDKVYNGDKLDHPSTHEQAWADEHDCVHKAGGADLKHCPKERLPDGVENAETLAPIKCHFNGYEETGDGQYKCEDKCTKSCDDSDLSSGDVEFCMHNCGGDDCRCDHYHPPSTTTTANAATQSNEPQQTTEEPFELTGDETYETLQHYECCRIGEKTYNFEPSAPTAIETAFFDDNDCKSQAGGARLENCPNYHWDKWDNSAFEKLECCRLADKAYNGDNQNKPSNNEQAYFDKHDCANKAGGAVMENCENSDGALASEAMSGSDTRSLENIVGTIILLGAIVLMI